jgi:hypothetical protein
MFRFILYTFSVVLTIFIACCGKTVAIENFDANVWKNDKFGCNGERMELAGALNEGGKQLMGLKKNNIIRLFGLPETTELHPKGQLVYRYNITPAQACETYRTGQNAQLLEIRINAMGIVSEAYISTFRTN